MPSSEQQQVNGDAGSPEESSSTPARTPFGHQMRQHFLFDADFTNLNHGSFGAYPSQVRHTMRQYQDRIESRPDPFIRYEHVGLLDSSRSALADYLHAPEDEVVFLPNATTGVNTVLRSLVFAPGDVILYFNTTYGSCAKTIQYICETTPAEGLRLDLEYPVADDELVRRFRDAIRAATGRRVRVAIVDTVVSMPGVRMPFERLVEVCREEGVLSLVDGAHGVGHIDLNLARLDADFFVSNCHKWLFTPRPCAVFHVPARNQALIRSSIPTSHGFQPLPSTTSAAPINPLPKFAKTKSPFITLFEFVGTIDPTPYLSVPAALAFRASVCGGEDAIREYCFDLALRGGKVVADVLGTEVLAPNESGGTCFANVRLPLRAADGDRQGPAVVVDAEARSEVAQEVMRRLADDHHTFVAVVWHGRAWWARLSAQVYLELSDFRSVARALGKVCEGLDVAEMGKEEEGRGKAKEEGKLVDGDVVDTEVRGMVESVAIN